MKFKRWRLAWVLLLLLPAGAVRAQETVWSRSCRFFAEVDGGAAASGAVYERRGTPDMLGRLEGGVWFLLQPAQRRALALSAENAELVEGNRRVILRGTLPAEGNRVTLTPSALTFDMGGHWIRVIPTPPLVGEVTPDAFLGLCPEFQDRERAYEPRPEMVEQIASADGDVSVEVFFGSWCPHCQQVLPMLIKSLRMAGNSKLSVKMIGLPRAFRDDPAVKARAVTGVPTVIVFQDGEEVGRFSGTEQIPVEESLAKLVIHG